eukprot:1161815-Pelagomonas_calceolata.AAC.12
MLTHLAGRIAGREGGIPRDHDQLVTGGTQLCKGGLRLWLQRALQDGTICESLRMKVGAIQKAGHAHTFCKTLASAGTARWDDL